ncbi:hypothetical protein KO498_11055 [Lentibacter algarum]|uniref:hypothetical protein n=1 Tax=Lentibacter algarum TaxID=576131 RepID=UPI001C06C4D4|nr:hypothetical protein [Lentibacter algarum]MBU2982345.1 hypothetical protein [Lentibacter algarum]
MSRGWKVALSIFGVFAVVLLACFMMIVAAFDPTMMGLRPHAVRDGLTEYTTQDILDLGKEAEPHILLRDVWYQRRGKSGWFVLTPKALAAKPLPFALRGELDVVVPKIFQTGPKNCGQTNQPAKAIILHEPERQNSNFVGRSTCSRGKMDINGVIEAAQPVARRVWWDVAQSTYLEQRAMAAKDASYLVGPIGQSVDPQPYKRELFLPPVDRSTTDIYAVSRKLEKQLDALPLPYGVSTHHLSRSLSIRTKDGGNAVFFTDGNSTYKLDNVEIQQSSVVFSCSPEAIAYCEDLSAEELSKSIPNGAGVNHLSFERMTKEIVELPQVVSLSLAHLRSVKARLGPMSETIVSFSSYQILPD